MDKGPGFAKGRIWPVPHKAWQAEGVVTMGYLIFRGSHRLTAEPVWLWGS